MSHQRIAGALVGLAACLLAACGGDSAQAPERPAASPQPVLGGRATDASAATSLGFPGFATKNTTRVGGADPTANAAGAALAVYPARTPQTRPAAVALADAGNWQAAISAAQLAAEPIGAPLLLASGSQLPSASAEALRQLAPAGAETARKAQVLRIGTAARAPGAREINLEGANPAALALAIDRLQTAAVGAPSRSVLVVSSAEAAYAMPAAAWAAKSGDPVLWTGRDSVPTETEQAIRARQRPRIYVLGPPDVVSAKAVAQLAKLGRVTRIAGDNAIRTSIAFARFSDAGFGWNVTDPGHGLVFASLTRPADAAAAASLSTSGTYGPLLLLDSPAALPAVVQDYLLDIQPGYEVDPVRGVYNHGWLMGDETAISVDVQSRIDALLEIQPVDPPS